MFTEKILKTFTKDYSLPIQVLRDPYFSYFIDLYDKDYQSKAKLQLLKDTINLLGSEEKFFDLRHQICDDMIESIKETATYNEFATGDMDRFTVPNKSYPSKDIFRPKNAGRYFLSIDLKKANFQALKHFFPEAVFNCEDYRDLIGRFTDLDYFKDSKYLRQVIFGNLSPKRQKRIQRFMMEQILDWAVGEKIFEEKEVRMVSSDEIIVELEDPAVFGHTNSLEGKIKNALGYDARVEAYRLETIGNSGFYVKKFVSKEGIELMCVPLVYFAQAYKKVNGLELDERDLCFMYENQVCKFLEPLDFGEEKENAA